MHTHVLPILWRERDHDNFTEQLLDHKLEALWRHEHAIEEAEKPRRVAWRNKFKRAVRQKRSVRQENIHVHICTIYRNASHHDLLMEQLLERINRGLQR